MGPGRACGPMVVFVRRASSVRGVREWQPARNVGGRGQSVGSGGSISGRSRSRKASCLASRPPGVESVCRSRPVGGGKVRDRVPSGADTRYDRTRVPRADARQQGATGSRPVGPLPTNRISRRSGLGTSPARAPLSQVAPRVRRGLPSTHHTSARAKLGLTRICGIWRGLIVVRAPQWRGAEPHNIRLTRHGPEVRSRTGGAGPGSPGPVRSRRRPSSAFRVSSGGRGTVNR